ncbi:hypothetical protein Tco_0613073 [Tanacetum coccineum]
MVRWVTKKNARGGAGLQFVINIYIRIEKTPEDRKIMISGLFMVEFSKWQFILNGHGGPRMMTPEEEESYSWEQLNSSDVDVCRAFLKLCIVEDPIWEKISCELEEPISNAHFDECVCCQVQQMTEENMYALRKEIGEIHTIINNDLKVLNAVIEDIARVLLQDIKEE